MKREGRQHGMVRTCRVLPSPFNPRTNQRVINCFDSPPTAGFFTKVQTKPTNHSKYTGKCAKPRCNDCHVNPCGKSKDKGKGSKKLKSCDVVSNYRLISWRVVDGRPGLNFGGFSATALLEHLASDEDRYVDDYDDESDHGLNYVVNSGVEFQEIVDDGGGAADDDKNHDDVVDDDVVDDDVLSYCDVGILLEQVEEDDGWWLVADM